MNETKMRGAIDIATVKAARGIMQQQESMAERQYTMQVANLCLGVVANRDKLLNPEYSSVDSQRCVHRADTILACVLDGIHLSNEQQAEQAETQE